MSRGLRERRQLSTRLQSQRNVFLAGVDLAQDASSPDPQGQDGAPYGEGEVLVEAGEGGRAVTSESPVRRQVIHSSICPIGESGASDC
jgi:hypothetical protein